MGLRRWYDGIGRTPKQINRQEALKEHCSMLLFKAMSYNNSPKHRKSIATVANRSKSTVTRALHGGGNMTLEEISDLFLALGYRIELTAHSISDNEKLEDSR